MSEKRLDFISAYEKIVYDLRKESGKLIQKNCISCELVNLQTREIDKLKKENEQLREINKELGDDLYNCRLNKNIIREKLKLWQDVHKEYGIYSIKDFEELMKSIK